MRRIRVLVVDDSAALRRLVTDAVQATPDLELAGTAQNGQIALDRVEAVCPDVVTLDVEMPVLDGLSTLRVLKARWPRLPVLMFSSRTERGALASLDALAAGASDFVAKPSVSGLEEARAFVEREVLPRLRALGGRNVSSPEPGPAPPAPSRSPPAGWVSAVVVGVSTGGPQALVTLLPALPRGLPVPVLVVQHMPPLFTRILAERLDDLGPNPVVEASDGLAAAPGRVYVAPGGHHLLVAGGRAGPVLRVGDGPPENSCRPAVDPLFRSAAEVWGPGLLAVVLTGMGRDGCDGAAHVCERGGAVIAQDRASSVVWGMPGAVVDAGLADCELPLAEIAGEIAARVARGRGHLVAPRVRP